MEHIIELSKDDINFCKDIETLTPTEWEEKYHERFNEQLPNDDMYCQTLMETKEYQVNLRCFVPLDNYCNTEFGYNELEIYDKKNDCVSENIPIDVKTIKEGKTIEVSKGDWDANLWFKLKFKVKK